MAEKNADIAVIKAELDTITKDLSSIKSKVFNGGCSALKTLRKLVEKHDKEIDDMQKQIWKNVGIIAVIQTVFMSVFITVILKIFGK